MNVDKSGGRHPLSIEIADTQSALTVDHDRLVRLARRTLESEGIARASISVALVDDSTMHTLNRRHLDHDWPTDVLSFVLSEPDEEELAGELIVSTQTAVSTARRAGHCPDSELALYLVHGLLHLCGHDDQDPDDVAEIRRREEEILIGEGWTNTFSAVAPEGIDDVRRECVSWLG